PGRFDRVAAFVDPLIDLEPELTRRTFGQLPWPRPALGKSTLRKREIDKVGGDALALQRSDHLVQVGAAPFQAGAESLEVPEVSVDVLGDHLVEDHREWSGAPRLAAL